MDFQEMRQHYVEKMGAELGPLFHAASSELGWMHWRWKQFRILFADKPARLELLLLEIATRDKVENSLATLRDAPKRSNCNGTKIARAGYAESY